LPCFFFSAKALDEYAAIESRATGEKNDGQWLAGYCGKDAGQV